MEIDIVKGKRESANVEASLLQWVAVHGFLSLGLRHIEGFAPSREAVLPFYERLGTLLVERGMLTQAELDEALEIERQVRVENLAAVEH